MSKVTDVDLHVGKRIRMQRIVMGVSQHQLGKATGVTFQQTAKRELGTNRISAGALYKIAKVLGKPVEFFFEGLERDPAVDTPDDDQIATFLADKSSIQLVVAFNAIKDQRKRKYVVDLANELAKPALR